MMYIMQQRIRSQTPFHHHHQHHPPPLPPTSATPLPSVPRVSNLPRKLPTRPFPSHTSNVLPIKCPFVGPAEMGKGGAAFVTVAVPAI